MFGKAINDLVGGLALWRVWTYQAWHEMTARYKRTILGPFWLAAQMLVTSMCLALVWGILMNRDMKEILPYITAGMLCFQVVSFMFNDGPELFLGAGNTIKNHAYPFTYYILETACKAVLTFGHNVIVFWAVCAAVQNIAVPNWTFLIAMPIVIITVMCWGTIIGLVSARFRDLRFLLPYFGQLMFYVTPIVWRVGDISTKRAYVAQFNPLYGLLEIIRAPLLGHVAPAHAWALAIGTMVTGMITWVLVFPPFRKRIAFWI